MRGKVCRLLPLLMVAAVALDAGSDNLEVRDILLEPVGQGKNIVTVQVSNLTDDRQVLVTDIRTHSPNVGRSGINWQTQFPEELEPGERTICRYAYMLQGEPAKRTSIRLRFYNPDSAEKFDPGYERYFSERTYTGSGVTVRKPDTSTPQPAPPEVANGVTRRFEQIQQLMQEKKHEDVWNAFTKELQQAGFNGGIRVFNRCMTEESPVFSWARHEFLSLVPTHVATQGDRTVLSVACGDHVWTLDFVHEDGLWKIDWIAGYVAPIFRWANWQERLLPQLKKRATDHFDIYYAEGSTAERDIEQIAQRRESGYLKVRDLLQRQDDIRMRLVLFEDENVKRKETGHQGMGWAYGTTMVEVYNETARLDPYHETTHVLAGALGHPPALFSEGFAVYMSERLGAPPLKNLGGGDLSVYARARELKQAGKWVSLKELLTFTEIGSRESRSRVSYPEAGAFVKFLIEAYGETRFLEAYETLRNSGRRSVHQRNRKVIERIYGKSLDALCEEWHAAIEQGETPAATGVANGVKAGTGYAGYRTASDPTFWVPAVPPRARYTLDARFSRQRQYGTLELTETIRFANNTGRPIERLALEYPQDICETLDVRVAGKPVTFIPAGEPPGSPALFALPSPAAPGDKVQLDVTFAARSPFPEEADSIPLVGWYPRLWWGFPIHDDYDVALEVPPEYTVGTSGRWNPDTRRYTIRGAKTFGVLLGKGHKVMEADAGDVRIRAVHTDAGEACARLLLETAVDVVTFYRERFGSYPYRTLTIVPGMDRPAGGYPMATALVAIHGQERMDERPELHWRWITAHEIGHQYWGEYVLEKDSPGWMWIGLGICADREYVRARRLGLKKHRELIARYIEGVEQGLDTTLALTPEQYKAIDYDYNNVSIHGKGYSIVSAIAWLLGQETFDRVYRRCLDEFAGRRLGASEFQAVCEEESGEDLAWFFDQWVRSNRYLSYEVASQTCTKQNGRYVSHVRVQRGGTLQMPVPVVAYFEDGTAQRQRTDRLLDVNELTFESVSPLTRVRIDPEGELAMAGPPAGAAKAAFKEDVRKLPWTGAGKRAVEVFHKAQEEKPEDADIWGKLGLALYDGKYYPEALEAFQRTAEYAEKGSTWSFVSCVWQGHILDLLGRREEAVKCYKEALKRDTGITMRHDQYRMQVNRRWILQRIKKPFERK